MRLTMRFPATTAGSIALMALLLVGCPDDTTGDGNGTTTASEDTVAPVVDIHITLHFFLTSLLGPSSPLLS